MFRRISFESESESLEKFRRSAPKMSDEELIRQGRMLRDLCKGPKAPEVWVRKLKILRDEWRRRHPRST